MKIQKESVNKLNNCEEFIPKILKILLIIDLIKQNIINCKGISSDEI